MRADLFPNLAVGFDSINLPFPVSGAGMICRHALRVELEGIPRGFVNAVADLVAEALTGQPRDDV